MVDEFHIIDCRFEYEYEGGHVRGATNINTHEKLSEVFLKQPKLDKRQVLVFHCEYSSQRAPRMAQHLRGKDRVLNESVYPKLWYPEIYVLDGGYKRFFAECPSYCDPEAYVSMNDSSFIEVLKFEKSRRGGSFVGQVISKDTRKYSSFHVGGSGRGRSLFEREELTTASTITSTSKEEFTLPFAKTKVRSWSRRF